MKKGPKLLMVLLSALLLSALLISCGTAATEQPQTEKTKFTLGTLPSVISIPETIQKHLESPYEMEIMVFDANKLPAVALNDGNIDALMANHKPWIDTFNKENNSNLVMVEPYIYYSIFGIYSLSYKSIDQIPQNSQIAIPGDATNMDRALRVLQSAGLITLGEKKEAFYTVLDVKDNPKNLKFPETETTATVSVIKDCAAVISFSVLMRQAGFMPIDDYLLFQDNDIYACGLVVQPENAEAPWVKAVLNTIKLPEFKKDFNDYWQGAYVLIENNK